MISVPGPQHQMEGVAKHDLRADLAQFLRRHRLDRAIGADRHKAGVSTTPRSKCKRPKRAGPSLFNSSKFI